MSPAARYLSPSEAARRLGVSAKALRLYERRGLIAPLRTAAGWRAYGPEQMRLAGEVVALRALGLSLAQIALVMKGEDRGLASVLAGHQTALEHRLRQLADTLGKVRGMRAGLASGRAPLGDEAESLMREASAVAFDLPWPWGGERFVLGTIRPLNYIVGPLGSGKTRFAHAMAQNLPGALFLGPERLADDAAASRTALHADPVLKTRADLMSARLVADGAAMSAALIALLAGLEAEGHSAVVVDMVEDGLDQASQKALIAWLRERGPDARPLFLMTRSTAILDLTLVGDDEAILFCPANHSPPIRVAPLPGAPGYEAVASCLASPEVRVRTAGVIASRPQAA